MLEKKISKSKIGLFFSKIEVSFFFSVFHLKFLFSIFRGKNIFSTPSCSFCTFVLFSSRLPTTPLKIINISFVCAICIFITYLPYFRLCNLHFRHIFTFPSFMQSAFSSHIYSSLHLHHILKYFCRSYE